LDRSFWTRHSFTLRYSLLGALLGIGAPLGALLLRLGLGAGDPLRELRQESFFYVYDFVGTALVFGAGGFFAGRRADRLRRGREHFRDLAEHDELTQLPNERSFQNRYGRVVARARRFGEPLSLLMVDVDELKKINDRHGHAAGSAALAHIARVLGESKRTEDMAARWGGDEFVILMPGATAEAAGRLAQTILERLHSRPLLVNGRPLPVTVTIGIASGAPSSPEELFETADRALYAGKAQGRNRFVVLGE
jgi:diguanylate cyclase (GGDEF)-like protein